MKTLIVYMTSHGCAGKAAGMIRDMLPGEVALIDLGESELPDPGGFDTVIIGGSIRIGNIQKRIKKFCTTYLEVLLQKRIGLYICCMFEGDTALDQFNAAFPDVIRKNSVANGLFGGELEFDKMNAFERMIIKQVANISVDVSMFNTEAVKEFAGKILKDEGRRTKDEGRGTRDEGRRTRDEGP